MGERSVIEWTDGTVNFWRGCTKVDPTCAECYMFRDQRRYGRDPSVVVRCSESVFYAAQRSKKWRERRERIEAEQGRRMRIFTCSWSDFFHEDVPAQDLVDAWNVIRECPEYDWQILTSRPERIAESLPADWGAGWPHVWLGVTIGNRRFVDRADLLRQTPAAVRFISAEPLLGPLVADGMVRWQQVDRETTPPTVLTGWMENGRFLPELDLTEIGWLIVGGESGGRVGRRLIDEDRQPIPQKLDWVRDLRDAAIATRTPFLFKQWGGPTSKSGGRELDGRTWDEFPQVAAVAA